MAAHPKSHPQASSPWPETPRLGEQEPRFVVETAKEPPKQEDLDAVACFWTELPRFDAQARTFLLEETLDDDSVTAAYVEHHVDGLRFEVLTELFGDADDLEIGTFLDALLLVRIVVSPARRTAVFDYSLGLAITDSVLAVSVSADGTGWSVDIATAVQEEES